MHILITGATGFVGSHLAAFLMQENHELTLISRHHHIHPDEQITWMQRDDLDDPQRADHLQTVEVVIHLAGYPITERWTASNKEKMHTSRVDRVRQVMAAVGERCHTLISASATGRFPSDRYALYTEHSATPDDPDEFLQLLCAHREQAAQEAAGAERRCLIVRLGNVLGNGGLLHNLGLFNWLYTTVGFGDGENWMSRIAIDDLVRLFATLLEEKDVTGVVHGVAPHPVTWKIFLQSLRKVWGLPFHLQLPAWVAGLMFGEQSKLLVGSWNVTSARFGEIGFSCQYKTVDAALAT